MAGHTVDQLLRRAKGHARKGDLAKAWKLYQAVLQSYPNNKRAQKALESLGDVSNSEVPGQNPPPATLAQLSNLYSQGHFDRLVQLAHPLVRSFPKSFGLWNLLGATGAQSGRLDLAETAFRQAAELNPGYAEAHHNLGKVLIERGKFEEAIEASTHAVQIDPGYVEALNTLGNALKAADRHTEAVAAYLRALKVRSDNAEVLHNLGNTFLAMDDPERAVTAFRNAVNCNPDLAASHNSLGSAYNALEQFDDALSAYSRALEIDPGFGNANHNMAAALQEMGRHDDAIARYQLALENQPDDTETLKCMANAYLEAGREKDAVSTYSQALRINPRITEIHWNLSTAKKFIATDPQIDQMKELHADGNLSDEERCDICFALAKSAEDLGDFKGSFAYLKEGNSIRRQTLQYDRSADEDLFSRIREADPGLRAAALSDVENPETPCPIFILGMPRSGTTLVEQIISSHRDVIGAGELKYVRKYGSKIVQGQELPDTESLESFRGSYLQRIARLANGKPFVTDKLPHNFLHIGLICNALPEAKIIHVNRKPAATCWSNYRQYFAEDGLGYSHDPEDVVAYFHQYRDLMEFWKMNYSDRIYDLDYEELTADQESQTRALIEHLGLEWDAACLSPQQNKRSVRTASQQQVRKAVYGDSSDAWRNFEPFLDGAFDPLISKSDQ